MTAPVVPDARQVYVPAPRIREMCKQPQYVTVLRPCTWGDARVCIRCGLTSERHP